MGPEDVLTYTWNFGDGSTGTGRAPLHAYSAPGTYHAVLTVTDGDGGHATASRDVAVLSSVEARPDSRGMEFWIDFDANNIGPPELTLFIASEFDTTGTVEIPGIGFSTPFTISAGGLASVPLPPEAQIALGGREPKGIHVVATSDVSVYGLNRILYTTDAYLGLPGRRPRHRLRRARLRHGPRGGSEHRRHGQRHAREDLADRSTRRPP